MADIFDLLLETDNEKLLKKNGGDIEIKRLSKVMGEKFVVNCRPLSGEQLNHLLEISDGITEHRRRLQIVNEGARIGNKKFSDKALIEKVKAATPFDVIDKLFLPGEIYDIYAFINKLSGYGKDVTAEIKNS